MSEMNKAFNPEFMKERQIKDRVIMLVAMNNVQKFTVVKTLNRRKHPFEVLDDKDGRRKE